MLPSWCNDTVYVLRASLITTQRGSEVQDWSNPLKIPIEGCSIQPANSAANTRTGFDDIRQNTTISAVLYAPPAADIRAHDRVVADGVTYTLDGEPLLLRSPTGRVNHKVCNLIEWSG
ncbi:MAG: hypothetical protein IKE43_09465 [Coriobacteriales bacterium]|nr:hypothetical protein [Coriobacteriales bacterium]